MTVVLIVAMIAGALLWRYLCRFFCIPWPSWLAWWLENPYMILFCHPRWLLQSYRIQPGMRVMELGCGAGRVSESIFDCMKQSGYLLLVDLQESMLRLARRRLQRFAVCPSLEFRQANILSAELPSQCFDRVIMVTVLGEMPDHDAVMRKIHQSLAVGGRLFITEVLPDPCYLSSGYLRRLGERCGFVVESVRRNAVAYTMSFVRRDDDLLASSH